MHTTFQPDSKPVDLWSAGELERARGKEMAAGCDSIKGWTHRPVVKAPCATATGDVADNVLAEGGVEEGLRAWEGGPQHPDHVEELGVAAAEEGCAEHEHPAAGGLDMPPGLQANSAPSFHSSADHHPSTSSRWIGALFVSLTVFEATHRQPRPARTSMVCMAVSFWTDRHSSMTTRSHPAWDFNKEKNQGPKPGLIELRGPYLDGEGTVTGPGQRCDDDGVAADDPLLPPGARHQPHTAARYTADVQLPRGELHHHLCDIDGTLLSEAPLWPEEPKEPRPQTPQRLALNPDVCKAACCTHSSMRSLVGTSTSAPCRATCLQVPPSVTRLCRCV